MAKGFGVKPEKQLGYVLDLWPEMGVYAAKFTLDQRGGEPYIGITNMLEQAQVWKSQKQAQQSIVLYEDFLSDRLNQSSEVDIAIKRLKQSESGQLKTERVASLMFLPSAQLSALPNG